MVEARHRPAVTPCDRVHSRISRPSRKGLGVGLDHEVLVVGSCPG
jgi:hypothetical protein